MMEEGKNDGRSLTKSTRTNESKPRLIKKYPNRSTKSGSDTPDRGSDQATKLRGLGELPTGGNRKRQKIIVSNERTATRASGVDRQIDSASQLTDRGIRDSASDHGHDARQAPIDPGTTHPTDRASGQAELSGLLESGVTVDSIGGFASITDSLPTLPQEAEIFPTKMLEKELAKIEASTNDDDDALQSIELVPMPIMEPVEQTETKKAKAKTKIGNEKKIVPGVYKFSSTVRQQLIDIFVVASELQDLAIDKLIGVDTSIIPIWKMEENEAEVFVRILERRAARNEKVRDEVVPAILAAQDYLEATMIIAPRTIATVQAIVENGGIKPNLMQRGKRDES